MNGGYRQKEAIVIPGFELTWSLVLLFIAGGAIAGFIDSIAGGGGLITLPLLSIVLGPGAAAIGSNKIVGVTGALTALIIYARHSRLDWRKGLIFVVGISVGSFLGSLFLPHLPIEVIRWFLIVACPVLLWVVWNKNLWVQAHEKEKPKRGPRSQVLLALFVGLACGFYDGAFGPGGGTFMFLALLFYVDLPLFQALAISKLANTVSASTALVSYAEQGFVHWAPGFTVAAGMFIGATVGAKLNLKKADRILRPVLALAVFLLLLRLLHDAI